MTLVLGIYQTGGSPTVPVNTTPPSISLAGSTATATPGVWTDAGTITGEWYLNGSAAGITTLTYDTSGLSDGDTVFYRETTLGVSADSNTITIATFTLLPPSNLRSSVSPQ